MGSPSQAAAERVGPWFIHSKGLRRCFGRFPLMLDQIAKGVGRLLFLSIGNFLKSSMLSSNSLSRSVVTGSFLLIS